MNHIYTDSLNVLLAFRRLDFSAITLPNQVTALNAVYATASNTIAVAIATSNEQLQEAIAQVPGSASMFSGR